MNLPTCTQWLRRSFAILIVFINGGFVLQRTSEHPWWIWGFWASPLQYSQNAICASVFPMWHLTPALGPACDV